MKFAIITQVPHYKQASGGFFSYAPYVKEMNIWLKYASEVIVVAPLSEEMPSAIDMAYAQPSIEFRPIASFHIKNISAALRTLLKIPMTCLVIFRAMKQADHIHLRCPGNIGLLGCIIQMVFPKKTKTAKYAGNWDLKSKQPWSYKLQRYLLSNTFLTRKMTVLVYGDWPAHSANVKPFFTATYSENDQQPAEPRSLQGTIRLLFVGTLSMGKRPIYAIQLLQRLVKQGYDVHLDLYGEGSERTGLETYIHQNSLERRVFLHGNQPESVVKKGYQSAHFLLLPSVSEGWPKVVAEAMFWGCVPASSQVSCIPDMLGNGGRGVLLNINLADDSQKIAKLLQNEHQYQIMADAAMAWSRKYTLEFFEREIKLLMKYE